MRSGCGCEEGGRLEDGRTRESGEGIDGDGWRGGKLVYFRRSWCGGLHLLSLDCEDLIVCLAATISRRKARKQPDRSKRGAYTPR